MNPDLLATIETLFNSSSITTGIPIQGVQQLAYQEGVETSAYQDSLGNWSIGVGHLGAYQGEVWTMQQCFTQLFSDIQKVGIRPVNRTFPWAKDAGTIRWWVLVNMSFNEGIMHLQGFTDTLQAFQRGDWLGVVRGMQASLWWSQVGQRARELAYQVYFNEWVTDELSAEQQGALGALLNG